jgi:hypothetical protein
MPYEQRRFFIPLCTNLKPPRLDEVHDALERLVLLALHIRPVHLHPENRQLVDLEMDGDRR